MAPESNTPNTNTPIRQNVAVPKPDAGANVTIDSSAGGQLQLGFDPSVATPSRSGNDLSFDVEGGGKVTVKDFFAVGDESLPSLRLPDGTVVASTDFFSGSGLDMTTAAGPGGGAGGAGSGSGDYRDDAGNLIGGIDRFGKLGTDFWGRGSEVPDPWIGDERPGGTFGFDTWTDDPGRGPVVTNGFWAGVFEDSRPHQNEGDWDQKPGQIYFKFNPTGTTSVTAIYLSGFDPGTEIWIGDPANGGYQLLPDAQGRYRFTEDMFNTSTNDSSHDGVYILPPSNSDHDMDITARVDLRTAGGQTSTMNGTFTVIVDAVADKADVKPVLDLDLSGDGYGGDKMEIKEDQAQKYEDGWAKDNFSKDSNGEADASGVVLTAKFSATIAFGDFTDGSETHYALIEIPSKDNVKGLATGEDPGTWEISKLPADMIDRGTVTLWYDSQGNVIGETPVGGDAPDGAVSHKDFFRIEVPNSYLQDPTNSTITDDPVKGERSEITIDIELEGTFDGTKGLEHDVHFELDAGAQVIDDPKGSGELTLDNNTSYTFDSDSHSGDNHIRLDVDTVDSKLEVKMGWVSEGNNPNKNLPSGVNTDHDWTNQSYENEADRPVPPDQKPDAAANTANGAPITLSISGGKLPEAGTPDASEHITAASFSFKADAGVLNLNGSEIFDGQTVDSGGVSYKFTVNTVGGETTVSIAISGPSANGVTDLNALDLTVTPKNYYEDADIAIKYTVDVESSSGAKAHYSGSSVVVVDAVADLSSEVTSVVDKPVDFVGEGTIGVDNSGDVDFHDSKGWETDTFELDYSKVTYSFKLTVTTTFYDLDGSENHYVLIENKAGWTIDKTALEAGGKYLLVDSDVPGFYKIQVVDSTQGTVSVEVPMKHTGSVGDDSVTFKTGSYVEEKLDVDLDGHPTGREYDLQNNVAVRTDGTEVTYEIDVLNSKLTVATGWGSEGGMDAKHKYTAEQIKADPSKGNDYALLPGNAYAGSTNDGKAPIEFSLSGGVGADETISVITFTLSAEDVAHGTLECSAGTWGTPVNHPDGSVTYTLTLTTPSDHVTVYFAPTKGSFDYSDVDVKYEVTVQNDAGGGTGAEYTFKGSSQIVIDAVADKPTAHSETNGSQVDYPSEIDPATGQPKLDNQGHEIEAKAAKPGDTVTVHGDVTFPDTSGGENHSILIEKPGTGGSENAYSIKGVTITCPDGSTITVDPVGLIITYPDGSTSALTTVTGQDGQTYYKIPVDNYNLGTPGTITPDSFSVDIEIKTATNYTASDIKHTVDFGGRAEVADNASGSSGGSSGSDTGPHKDNYEFDKANNTSDDFTRVNVNVNGVSSKVWMKVGNYAYENADRDANEGYKDRSDMSVAEMQGSSAKLNFSGLSSGESIAALAISFKCLTDVDGIFIPTGNLMYGNTMIPVDYTGAVVSGTAGAGSSAINYTCTYDPVTGQVTVTMIPVDGKYQGGDQLYFVPEHNYRSDDIPLEFGAIVKDDSSGYAKASQSTNGGSLVDDLCDKLHIDTSSGSTEYNSSPYTGNDKTGDVQPKVDVDAVAQQAGLKADITSEWSGEEGYVVPGRVSTIHLDADLRGDVVDGTESHWIYVEAKDGYKLEGITIKYMGTDGLLHDLAVPASGLQPVGNTTYHTFKIDLTDLTPPAANGKLSIDVDMRTPDTFKDGGHDTISVGVVSHEEWYLNNTTDNKELELPNNHADTFKEVDLTYNSCKMPGIEILDSFYENTTPHANAPPITDFDKPLNTRVEITISTGDSVDGSPDKLVGFDLKLDESDGSDKLGLLVLTGADGTVIGKYTEITLDMLQQNGLVDAKGNFTGHIYFEPDTQSYSGQDPHLVYTIVVEDATTKQTMTATNDYPGADPLSITADSVAQVPTKLDPDAGDLDGKVYEGTTHIVTVDATFQDIDGSTEHYILIEALGGWTVKVGGKEYGPEQLVTFEQGGKVYYKIDVTDQVNDLNAPAGQHTGSASVTVEMTTPKGAMYLGDYTIDVKAGSTDGSDGGELTFHNNTAVISSDGIEGNLGRDGGDGTWYFEQTAPLYEDNMPNQHLPLRDSQGNIIADSDPTKAAGHFDVTGPDGGKIVITVETILVDDGSGNMVPMPVLEISGHGVSYDSATGTYTIDLTAYNAGGKGGIDVMLSKEYLEHGGAHSDVDQLFKDVKQIAADGSEKSLGAIDVVVDAVADRSDIATESHYMDMDTGVAQGDIGGDKEAARKTDSIAGNKAGGEFGDFDDSVAYFTVTAHFNDTDGSESHYVLVEKTPAWSPVSDYKVTEVYIDGKTYYRFDVTEDANNGLDTFKIGLAYHGGGGSSADGLTVTYENGVWTYGLKVGTMSVEDHLKDNGSFDGEFRIDNNIAINLEGEVTLQYSPVESTLNVGVPPVIEASSGAFDLTIGGITGPNDVLSSLKIEGYTGEGELHLTGPNGYDLLINPANGYSITDADILKGLLDGSYKLTFTPDGRTHEDVSIKWSGSVKDSISGASKNFGPTTEHTVIDAVADKGNSTEDVIYADGHEAAMSGQAVNVVINATFPDHDNISEQHWVVLEQVDLSYSVTKVLISLDGGATWEAHDYIDSVVTMFDKGGKPYFAIDVSKIPGVGLGDCAVQMTVTTPKDRYTEDTTFKLQGGTIVVETTKDTDANHEPHYSDNWEQELHTIEIDTAVVTTTAVTGSQATAVTENQAGETAGTAVNLNLTGPQADPYEVVTKLVIDAPTAAQGTLTYNGQTLAIVNGKITITDAAGIDSSKLVFTPTEYWSGQYKPNFTATVEDTKSGATKENLTGSVTITVTGQASTPDNVEITGSGSFSVDHGSFTLPVKADFPDITGEAHYILIAAVAGLNVEGGTLVDGAAYGLTGQFYAINVGGGVEHYTGEVTFTATPDYAGGTIDVYALSTENGTHATAHASSTVVAPAADGFDYYTVHGTYDGSHLDHGVEIHGGAGNDTITGSNHGDTIYGGGGNDTIYGGAGNDTIYGGAGNDEIHGGAGNDIIYAGSGDNLIHGGAGDDVMYSGSGNNTFLWLADDFGTTSAAANDTIQGFKLNHDVISFKDVFGSGDTIDSLLQNATVDASSKTVTFTSGDTTFEAEFKSDSQLMLTLRDDQGHAVQTIDVQASANTFYDSSAADSLSDHAMREILENMIKNNN